MTREDVGPSSEDAAADERASQTAYLARKAALRAARDYRAFVGPSDRYDLVSANQFSLLLALGLREQHAVLDVGCGSLRAGRLLIPYLRPGHYYGIEPERWSCSSTRSSRTRLRLRFAAALRRRDGS